MYLLLYFYMVKTIFFCTKEYETTKLEQAPNPTPLLVNIGKPLPANNEKKKTAGERTKEVGHYGCISL